MKGHIRPRGKNKWSIVVELPRSGDGKRKQKWFSVEGRKSDAQKELRKVLLQLDEGTFTDPGSMTIGQYLDHWLDNHATNRVSPLTLQRYRRIVDQQLKPAFGGVKLRELRPTHVQRHYADALKSGRKRKKGGLSPTTVRQHHLILRHALKCAVKERLISWNPTDAVDSPRPVKQEIDVLTEEQTKTMLEVAHSSVAYVPVLLAATTGMRRGEILGLKWADIDFKKKTLSVRRALEQTKGNLRFKEPKTRSGRRTIALPHMTLEGLRGHKKEQATRRLQLGPVYKDEGLVCPSPTGGPWKPDSFSSTFRKLRERVPVPTIRFHDLRHSHASQLLKAGVHPKVVSERLGHSTISITLDLYSHVLPGLQEEAAERIDAALGGA